MNNKIKIFIFHPYSAIGGADLSLSRLINNLNHEKYDITFITLGKPRIKNYLTKKIEIISLKKNKTIFSIFKIRKILKKSKLKYKKTILISNQNFANVISVLALFNLKWIKLILIERNNIIELYDSKSLISLIKKRIILLGMKYLYHNANFIVGVSKDLSKDLSNLIKKKVVTIYNPGFDKNILKKKTNIKYLKKISNIKNKIILNVGRFEDQKNQLMLARAFKECSKQIDATLLFVGYGSKEQILKNYIKKNNLNKKTIFLNIKGDVYDVYRYADLFVLSSNYEGFGNVLVEAGMFKVPIISTNCKSGPNEILKNGEYGDLVNVNDHIKLSNLIIKNIKNPNKNKINKMYNSLKRFTIEKNIKEYEKIFYQI